MTAAPWQRRKPYQKPAPDAGAIAGAMLAHAPTAEAAERVTRFSRRVLRTDDTPKPKRKGREGNTNRVRGLAVEGRYRGDGCAAVLAREGYRVMRPEASMGAADVWAVRGPNAAAGPVARLVQVKRRAVFEPSALNDAIRRFLGLGSWANAGPFQVGEGVRREAWLWVDGEEWAAKLCLDHADTVCVLDGPRADACRQACEATITKYRAIQAAPPAGDVHAAFRARLLG